MPTYYVRTKYGDNFGNALHQALGNRYHDVRSDMPLNPDPKRRFHNVDANSMPWIVIHHTASGRSTTATAIANYHIGTRNFASIGYHLLFRYGHVYYVGDLYTQRAHIKNQNDNGIGFSITGDYTRVLPEEEDLVMVRRTIAVLDEFMGHEKKIVGHKEVPDNSHTTCPARVMEVLHTLRSDTPPPVDPFEGYVVGPGVRANMERLDDVPLGDETYIGHSLSITIGEKFAYAYTAKSRRVKIIPYA